MKFSWAYFNSFLFSGKGLSLGENLKVLQDLMYNVGVPNSSTSLDCFTAELAVLVLQYVQYTLFQHYALFQYLFTEEQDLETLTATVSS